jgi:hypothetical protein
VSAEAESKPCIDPRPLAPEPPEVATLSTEERRFNLETRTAQADVNLRIQELRLNERDIKVKEEASRKSAFRDPVFVGLIAAAIGFFGNFVVTRISENATYGHSSYSRGDSTLCR